MADSISSTFHRGSCFCGSVSYEVKGTPIMSAYCHCTLCQRLNGSAFIHTLHFPSSSFSWTHPAPQNAVLDSYSVHGKPWKIRWRCRQCGSTAASHNIQKDKWSVWGAQLERGVDGKILDWNLLRPTAHMFYTTRMLDIDDELDKWEGYPEQSSRIQ
ncbi:Mss4-like protein [Infundibulicybe gibba]|nr:Mss4-like protein [Infundibulicybe gibba]